MTPAPTDMPEQPPRRPPTAAWPLALATMWLVVYASLYPFRDWRDQGQSPLMFMSAPLPRYWTGFDVGVNLLGYMPVGFLLALAVLRGGRWRRAVLLATLAASALSLSMESLQAYLPARVPSNVDFALNTLGAWLGAGLAYALEKRGAIDRWNLFRARWFTPDARGALVLLTLWPPALLFPASVPLGLGQVIERLERWLSDALAGTPFLHWLPVRDIELQPLVPAAEVICVALGGWIPCLLAYGVVRATQRRVVLLMLLTILGIGFTALSAALSYGPDHAWAWLDTTIRVGLLGALALGLLSLRVSPGWTVPLALLALVLQLALLNQAPADPYFEQTRQIWEQGRFVRFNGLAQWLGWLWPFAVLLYLLLRWPSRSEAKAAEPVKSEHEHRISRP